MPVNRKAIEAGFAFEDEFVASTGGKKQIGSGNRFYSRLDVNQGSVLWSLKSAPTARSIRITADMIMEMVAATEGPHGTGAMPAMGIRFLGIPEDLTLVRNSDFFRVLRGEIQIPSNPSRGELRRAIADAPLMSRTD